MSRDLFERVVDALPGMLPASRSDFEHRAHGAGVKIWWRDAPREHYEAQLIRSADHDGPLLEIGFHAEHPDEAKNEAVVARLTAPGTGWKKAIGGKPEAGAFLGGPSRPWRRVSEVWTDVDVDADDLAIEVADRLAAYIEVLEPLRTV